MTTKRNSVLFAFTLKLMKLAILKIYSEPKYKYPKRVNLKEQIKPCRTLGKTQHSTSTS